LILSGEVTPSFGQVEKLVDMADLTVGSSVGYFRLRGCPTGAEGRLRGVCGPDTFGRFLCSMNSQSAAWISRT